MYFLFSWYKEHQRAIHYACKTTYSSCISYSFDEKFLFLLFIEVMFWIHKKFNPTEDIEYDVLWNRIKVINMYLCIMCLVRTYTVSLYIWLSDV